LRRDAGRLVVDLQPDGDLLFAVSVHDIDSGKRKSVE
jgi:hypothetical protein